MNILPKKNWHVRKKENIARVRRDEAEAAAIEKERLRKIEVAEKEARVKLLKEKSKILYPNQAIKPEVKKEEVEDIQLEQSGHINFFKELEDGLVAFTGTNKDYEKEKKEESEKYEKQIGYLTYLGQDTVELTGNVSWFNKLPERLSKIDSKKQSVIDSIEVGSDKKSLLDPLKDFKRYLGTNDSSSRSLVKDKTSLVNDEKGGGKKIDGKRKREQDSDSDSECVSRKNRKKHSYGSELKLSSKSKRRYSDSKKKWKKRKKGKKHRKSKHKSESEEISLSSSDSDGEEEERLRKVKLEALRAQRMQREAEENLRARRHLAKLSGEVLPEDKKPTNDPVIKRKYNSQFNPHLAKQNFIEDANVSSSH